jgi:hypothetical protein
MTRPSPAATALAMVTLSLAGCGAIKVRSASSAPQLQAKPSDCDIDLLFKAPKRAYQEIAELDAHVTRPGGSPEVFHEKACELGADAIIVIRDFMLNPLGHKLEAAMAIKYSEPKLEGVPGSAAGL